jgi:hypothetical protein
MMKMGFGKSRVLTGMLGIGVLGAAFACGSSMSITVKCKPGATESCQCATGGFGTQICGSDEQFGACTCTPVTTGTGGSRPSGGDASPALDAAADTSTVPPLATGTLLASGTSHLIDAFLSSNGVVVVTADSISIVDRAGVTQKQITAPREITRAALEGSTLAVADRAVLTMYAADLTQVASASLVEACIGLAIVGGNRVICSGSTSYPRKFYAYNATSGALVQTTSLSTSGSTMPMWRIPGKDDLVSFDVYSSASFQLFRVDASSLVSIVGSSPYDHAYHASSAFAFVGSPGNHVLTEDGVLAAIYTAQCDPSFTTNASCFVQDGLLGTLRGTERFIGLDGADGSGKVYGLVDLNTSSSTFPVRRCVGGCSVERIDVTGKVVETKKAYSLELGQVIAARHDAVSGALLVGYVKPGSSSTTDPYPGFRVELLAYE